MLYNIQNIFLTPPYLHYKKLMHLFSCYHHSKLVHYPCYRKFACSLPFFHYHCYIIAIAIESELTQMNVNHKLQKVHTRLHGRKPSQSMDASQFSSSNLNSSKETPKEGKKIFIAKHFAIFQTNLNQRNKQ